MAIWYPITGRVARRLSGDVERARAVGEYADPRLRARADRARLEPLLQVESEASARGRRATEHPAREIASLAARRVQRPDLVLRYPRSANNSLEPLMDGPRAF